MLWKHGIYNYIKNENKIKKKMEINKEHKITKINDIICQIIDLFNN